MRSNMDYLFSNITILDPVDGEKRNRYLGVSGRKICYLSDTKPEENAARVIDGKNKLLIPGLKNTHTHIAMTALRGVCDDKDLNSWLFGEILPREAKLDKDMAETSATVGLLEAAAGGTTGICDMYYYIPEIARAAARIGIRGSMCNAVLCTENFTELDRSVTELKQLIEEFSSDPLIKPVAGIHCVHTTYPEVWEWVREFASEHRLPIILHMSEARADNDTCKNLYGDTPAAVLEKNGLFTPATLIAHGVWVDDRDLALMAESGVSLAHCPVSNLKLASGIAPIEKYVASGVNVTIGTDGVASNNSLDMFEEMKFAVLLQRGISLRAGALTAADVFRFATVNACRALGIENCGLLKPGYEADIVMIDTDRPGLYPQRDALSNLVYCTNSSDVALTMVRGRVIYENGEFPGIDHEQIMAKFCDEVVPKLES